MRTLVITSDRIGRGDDDLGAILMRNLFYSLARSESKPERILFMNAGVRLACNGSESLEDLRLLLEDGVSVKSCGTCLDFLGLTEELAVGAIGTMGETVEALAAGEVVSLS